MNLIYIYIYREVSKKPWIPAGPGTTTAGSGGKSASNGEKSVIPSFCTVCDETVLGTSVLLRGISACNTYTTLRTKQCASKKS